MSILETRTWIRARRWRILAFVRPWRHYLSAIDATRAPSYMYDNLHASARPEWYTPVSTYDGAGAFDFMTVVTLSP